MTVGSDVVIFTVPFAVDAGISENFFVLMRLLMLAIIMIRESNTC